MLVVMQSDSIISAKGFKAQYTRACGARIIVKDHGFLTPPTGSTDIVHSDTNCTWTLIAENPGNPTLSYFKCLLIDICIYLTITLFFVFYSLLQPTM